MLLVVIVVFNDPAFSQELIPHPGQVRAAYLRNDRRQRGEVMWWSRQGCMHEVFWNWWEGIKNRVNKDLKMCLWIYSPPPLPLLLPSPSSSPPPAFIFLFHKVLVFLGPRLKGSRPLTKLPSVLGGSGGSPEAGWGHTVAGSPLEDEET